MFLYLAVFTEKAKFSHVSKVSAIKVLITSIVITAGDLSFVYGASLYFYRLSLWLIFLICLFILSHKIVINKINKSEKISNSDNLWYIF